MKKVYNYKKINKRIEELNSMRDENGHFIGTDDELDELMNLDTYKRQTIEHALCLDLKTNVIHAEHWFPVEPGHKVAVRTTFLVLNGIPYTFELEDIEGEDYSCYNNFRNIGVKTPIHGGKVRKFLIFRKDVSCCGCYGIEKELAA